MHRLDWIKEEISNAHGTIEFLMDDVGVTEDIENEDQRADLLVYLEDAYESLNEAMKAAYRHE